MNLFLELVRTIKSPFDLRIIGTLPGGEFSDPSSEEVDLLVPISTGDRPKLFKEVSFLFYFCFHIF